MIFLIHGEDVENSYQKLQEVLSKFPSHKKINLDEKNTQEDFYLNLFSKDLFDDKKIVVCTNFLKDKKIFTKAKEPSLKLENDEIVIFWEKGELTPKLFSKLPKSTIIEVFKKKPEIFWFLDDIGTSKNSVEAYRNLEDKENVLWQMTARILLLLLAKLNATKDEAASIFGKNLADWQWQKIKNQSLKFNLSTLINIFNSLIKADFSIKSGKTDLTEQHLLPHILVKYLRP